MASFHELLRGVTMKSQFLTEILFFIYWSFVFKMIQEKITFNLSYFPRNHFNIEIDFWLSHLEKFTGPICHPL